MKKRLSILVLSAVMTLSTACGRSLDDAPNVHKEKWINLSQGQDSRIQPFGFQLNGCVEDTSIKVRILDFNNSGYETFIEKAAEFAPKYAAENGKDEKLLCTFKRAAIEKYWKASFERDYLKALLERSDKLLANHASYTSWDRNLDLGLQILDYAIYVHENAQTSLPHLVFAESMDNFYDIISDAVQKGHTAYAQKLASQYIDFSERLGPSVYVEKRKELVELSEDKGQETIVK